MPKSKNRIELYHLGKEDAMTEFKHRHRKNWWPDSSQYKRGLFDGMVQLKNRGELRKLIWVYWEVPPSVRKRWEKAHGEPQYPKLRGIGADYDYDMPLTIPKSSLWNRICSFFSKPWR